MFIFRQTYIFLYHVIDKFFHQKRISNYLKKNLEIKLFFDVGCHLGDYSDMVINNYPEASIFMFEPQKKIFDNGADNKDWYCEHGEVEYPTVEEINES